MPSPDLCFMSAVALARLIRAREISAAEVLDAHLAQIARANPAVNAIITHTPELARAQADAADLALAEGRLLGPLHGLPIGHKDLQATRGIRTHDGIAVLSRVDTGCRHAHSDAATCGGGRLRGQDQRARVRRRIADLQHPIRADPQPL